MARLTGWPPVSAPVLAWRTRCHCSRQGQHLVQRCPIGDEIQIDELLARRGELLITQAQPPGQRGRAVVAQALGVGHRDQEQVQRGRSRLAAVDEVLLHERLVNPAELLGTWRSRSGRSSCLMAFTAPPVDHVAPKLYEAPGGAGHVIL